MRQTFSTNVRMQFVYLYLVGAEALENAAEDVTAAVREGALAVGEEHGLPLHHFPLEEAAAAHAAVEDGVEGKVLVDVGDD